MSLANLQACRSPATFYFPLTCKLPPSEIPCVIAALAPVVSRVNTEALHVDALSVFAQTHTESSFVLVRRYGFDETVEVFPH